MSLPTHNFSSYQFIETKECQGRGTADNNIYELNFHTPLEQPLPAIAFTYSNTGLDNILPAKNTPIPVASCIKPKRFRTSFTSSQFDKLEVEFKRSRYIHRKKRFKIAQTLSISEKSVRIWFQNRRTKYKKELQACQESATKAAIPNMKQNMHKDIVHRLMSYSQDQALQTAYKHSCSTAFPTEQTTANQNHMPSDLHEFLGRLEDNSPQNSQYSSLDSLINGSFYVNMEAQPLQQSFDNSTQSWSVCTNENENHDWNNKISDAQNETSS